MAPVLLLLSLATLASPALAADTLPLRATYRESVSPGESPSVVQQVVSATVSVRRTTDGLSLPTKGEVLVSSRSASGEGGARFEADPSGSVRTWAFTLLDADGNPLTAEPEIVDIVVGADGEGQIAARASADIVVRTVKLRKRGVSRAQPQTHEIAIELSQAGSAAAYVGIEELSSDGSTLGEWADLSTLDAGVYAAFQGLQLQAIVPIQRYAVTVEGDLSVEGLTVAADGAVEGGADLRFDLAFLGGWSKAAGRGVLGGQSYTEVVEAKVTRKATTLKRVNLQPGDRVYDQTDGSLSVTFDGDAQELELDLSLDLDGEIQPTNPDVVLLDPSDLVLRTSASCKPPEQPDPTDPSPISVEVLAFDAAGGLMGEPISCAIWPLDPSAGTPTWVGDCLPSKEGLSLVRSVRAHGAADGHLELAVTFAGATGEGSFVEDLDSVAITALDRVRRLADACTGLQGLRVVQETSFTAAFAFAGEVDGVEGTLAMTVYNTEEPVDYTLTGVGDYRVFTLGAPTWGAPVYAKGKTRIAIPNFVAMQLRSRKY